MGKYSTEYHPNGFFTLPLGTLPAGTYTWRLTDATSEQPPHRPNYLANSGALTIGADPILNIEIGTMHTGDANHDNVVSAIDFTILKNTFGKTPGDPGYDMRADFTGDSIINATDFNPLRNNFGHSGSPPINPSLPFHKPQ